MTWTTMKMSEMNMKLIHTQVREILLMLLMTMTIMMKKEMNLK